ncbi:AAA family ATPase [Pseudonocardia spirodelae]|uniref:DUF3696 domain-containing protein n=1 Tax=Pseudonocardia spirodelae TaxID=3133431 RepID=A0ABU8T0E9_9PSEU
MEAPNSRSQRPPGHESSPGSGCGGYTRRFTLGGALVIGSAAANRIRIREWIVENFKSIEHASTRLPPLSLLAGANSAGKSSLLQSLLLVAQSDNDSIVLNGPLVRLGLAGDVIRAGTDHCAVGAVVRARLGESQKQLSDVAFRIELKNADGELVVHALAIYVDDEPVIEATSRGVTTSRLEELNLGRAGGQTILRIREIDGRRAPSRSYVGFGGLGPEAFIYRVQTEDRVKDLRRALRSPDRYIRMQTAIELERQIESEEWDLPEGSPLQNASATTIAAWTPEEIDAAIQEIQSFIPEVESVAVQVARTSYAIASSRRSLGYQASSPGIAKFVRALRALGIVNDTLRTIRTSARYLGPLRSEPQVVSRNVGSTRNLPVGARGEATADHLVVQSRRTVRYADWTGAIHADPLEIAVSKWVHYLGIGDSVTVLDQGKLGRGLRVLVDGNERDLTTIGVGASQVLPVVALVLGASRGDLIMIEQPELHLHPAVQSRLADFFMLARADVHLLIETHSEYLLTRLRLRIAQGRFRSRDADVLYAQQVAGVTSIDPLSISELGDLSHWPTGFFDTQDIDGRDLVVAVRAKLDAADNAPSD